MNLGDVYPLMKQEQNSFPESRMTDNHSLFPAAIATATSPLVALISMSKRKTGTNSKRRIFVRHIPIIWDVNGCSLLRKLIRSVSLMKQRLTTQRKARQKLTDYINCFDPCTDEKEAEQNKSGQPVPLAHVKNPIRDDDSSTDKAHKWSRYTRTNQLQRLVDTWQKARETLTYNEFRALRLRVLRHGQVYLHEYITHIQKGLTNQYAGVIFGGGALMKRYGRGFLINFFDKHDGNPVRLYIDKNLMEKGRLGHYIDDILGTENVRYFRIFLLNPNVSERKDRAGKPVINLEISSLRQLAIYYELNSSIDD